MTVRPHMVSERMGEEPGGRDYPRSRDIARLPPCRRAAEIEWNRGGKKIARARMHVWKRHGDP